MSTESLLFQDLLQKENVRLEGEMLNLKVTHSLQSQGHHRYKKSLLLELRLSGRRQCQDEITLMKNCTGIAVS